MPEVRAITVSVGYGPLLEITLVHNLRHFSECVVITSHEDERTQEVACSIPGVRLVTTDAFTRHGARFNKGLALETGFDVLGRHGWIMIWDSDILFPDTMPLDKMHPTKLYGARRRILEDPSKWHPDLDWRTCPISRDGGPIGFFQAFHADDPAIKDKRPWYDVSFAHAGGSDAAFMGHWSAANRHVLPIDVLHLGSVATNWFGVDQESRDMMARFVHENGWRSAMRTHSLDAVKRSSQVVHRVQIPGYEPSSYELPFVKRAKRVANNGH